MDSNKYIISLCNSIINNSNNKEIDLHYIFRFLTNPKSKFRVDFSKINLGKFDTEDPELKKFIETVNPFYDFKNKTKNIYYAQHYSLAQILHDTCIDLLKDRNTVDHYCIRFTNTKHFLTYDDIDDDKYKHYKTDMARYDTREEAIGKIEYYLSLYRYLEIKKQITLMAVNKQDEVLEEEELI